MSFTIIEGSTKGNFSKKIEQLNCEIVSSTKEEDAESAK